MERQKNVPRRSGIPVPVGFSRNEAGTAVSRLTPKLFSLILEQDEVQFSFLT